MKVTIKKFKEAIKGSAGVYASIAKKLGVERSTVTRFLNKHSELGKFVEEEREKMIDLAENKLFLKIKDGEWKPTEFYLKTKGKHRGYVEKQEIEHSGEIDKKLEVILVDGNEDKQKPDEGSSGE